jgi:hypothetical protein
MLTQSGFRRTAVLKSDVFSTIERGVASTPSGEIDAIRRDVAAARWWAAPLARHFARREARALAALAGVPGVPALLHADRDQTIRAFIAGLPMQLARPTGERAYFAEAKRLLRTIRRRGVCHNDLAKEPNWLVGPGGEAGLTDLQLATLHRRRGKLYRLLAHEDLRHLLKHKRTYCPEALLPSEKRMLARRSLPARLWLATGKKVYVWVTRGLLDKRDREGGGNRLVVDAPLLEAALADAPGVTAAAVVAFPYPRKGVGLYAFVEAAGAGENDLRRHLEASLPGVSLPEHVQMATRLPRRDDGAVQVDILKLVAMNQIDLIAPLIGSDQARAEATAALIEGRLNLSDRRVASP